MEFSKMWNDNCIFISGDFIERIYNQIKNKEYYQTDEIKTLQDFYDYIKSMIASNLEYDFDVSVDIEDDIQQTSMRDIKWKFDKANQLDWSRSYVEDIYNKKLTDKQANDLAATLVNEIDDNDYLADEQSEIERDCIREWLIGEELIEEE